jgi:hypothetical protein
MRFVAVHKAATYLMVLTSTLSVFASGELAPLAPWAFLVLAVLSAVRPDTPGPSVLVERLWTLASLGVLVFLGVGVFQGEPALIQGVYLLLWLLLARLFNRRTSRDYLQLYVLSFMLVVASTAVDADLTYGVQFLLYVVFGTWALILFHLKREMEENYLLKYGDTLEGRPVQIERVLNSRKLVGPQFLLATSAVALLVFAGSTAVFVFFPRVGLGMFFQKQRPGILMSGFSDRVELGQFGTIKDDPTVVMRVELPGHTEGAPPPRYWRGLTLDHYDGTTWTKSRPRRWRVERALSGMAVFRPDLRGEEPLVQSIYLEPMETRVLFGANAPFAVTFADSVLAASSGRHRRSLQMDAEGDVHYEQADEVAFKYTALSTSRGVVTVARGLSRAGRARAGCRGLLAAPRGARSARRGAHREGGRGRRHRGAGCGAGARPPRAHADLLFDARARPVPAAARGLSVQPAARPLRVLRHGARGHAPHAGHHDPQRQRLPGRRLE